MLQNSSTACQAAVNDPLCDDDDTEEAPVLPEQDYVRLAPALDLSTDEWMRIFQAHSGKPSFRRTCFHETIEDQLKCLPWNMHDDDPCSESLELAKRIDALPRILKMTVLEAIERFWTDRSMAAGLKASSWEDYLQQLGLQPCESAHARLAALAHRRHVLSE